MIDKNKIKEGDIILFHTKGLSPISIGIRSLTQSFWNHVGMVAENVFKKQSVIEALGRGVVITPLDKYIGNKNYILKVVRLRPEAFKDEQEYTDGLATAIERLREAVGTPYDWWAITWLGIKYSIRAFWNKGTKYLPERFNPFQSRYKFFCSKLVCVACYQISSKQDYLFQGNTKQDCSSTTPRDISKSSNCYYITGIDKN